MKLLRTIIVIISLIINYQNTACQLININDSVYYKSLEAKWSLSGNSDTVRFNIAGSYEEAFQAAISYFPSLSMDQIDLKFKKIRTSMATRPKLNSIFKSKEHREYYIFINNDTTEGGKGTMLNQLDLLAHIGIFSHELSHIYDYSTRSKISLLSYGFGYALIPSYKRKIEHKADEITIAQGSGLFLYRFNTHLLALPGIPSEYLDYKNKYYYTPGQLIDIMYLYPDLYPEFQ